MRFAVTPLRTVTQILISQGHDFLKNKCQVNMQFVFINMIFNYKNEIKKLTKRIKKFLKYLIQVYILNCLY